MKMLLVVLLLLLALSSSSFGNRITLLNANHFNAFVNSVNSGTVYSGTTVFLDSDLSLSGETLGPIGKDSVNYFLGVFDGQGHTISDLKMNTSSQYTGLFGYSNGLTIKNVVLDSSCSVNSSFKGSSVHAYAGGIIGGCYANSRECTIENSVNMADVTFNGSIDNSLFIGGFIGSLPSSVSYNAHAKNCVNYGSVTDSGLVSNWAELGGIAGYSQGSSSSSVYIQNCLNYGTITHSGTSTNLIVGGIVGNDILYTYIENCVSAGKIFVQTTASGENNVGSIVGKVNSNIHINYCYYTSDVGVNRINGTGAPSSTTGTLDISTDLGSDLVSKLNSNATSCGWNKWFMLHLNGGSINNLTQENLIEIQGQIPDPTKEGNSFLFWCKDDERTEEFDPEAELVSGITDLYAAWVNNTVTFDFGNGTTVDVTFSYNTEIIYPKEEGYTLSWSNYHEFMPARDITVTAQWIPNNYAVTFNFDNGTTVNATFSYNTEIIYPEDSSIVKEGYTFNQWSNYHEFIPAKNITVTAQWTPNNYTVTFDANGGSVSETSKVFTFNEKYGTLPEAEKLGYIFIGWFANETNGIEVTNETIVTVPYNHTLYAHWEEVTTQVEIVFSSKDLTKEEVKNIIKQYTNAKFEITEYEVESDGIKIIIGFTDKGDAVEFVRDIEESSEMSFIKRIDLVSSDDGSISTMIYPFSFLSVLFL